jgi:RND family efflux transporter MFP subunit
MTRPRLLLAGGLLLLLAGCQEPPPTAKGDGPGRPDHLVELAATRLEAIGTAHQRTGTLRPRRSVRIHTEESGRITRLPYFEGDAVAAGALLFALDDELLRAELAKASATARQARLNLERVANLAKRQSASEEALTQARTDLEVAEAEQHILETRLGRTQATAPFAGVISARLAEPGDVAPGNTHLLTLIDPASLVVEVRVSELLLPQLRAGDGAPVRIDALAGEPFPGRILRIHPEVDPQSRQGIVEIALDPIPADAKAGQLARVTLESTHQERLLIPFTALRHDRAGEFVYRLDGEGKVMRVPVRSGLRLADRVEVLEGLQQGDSVIRRGFLGLTEGKRVKVAEGTP